jgi:hypothetical protein
VWVLSRADCGLFLVRADPEATSDRAGVLNRTVSLRELFGATEELLAGAAGYVRPNADLRAFWRSSALRRRLRRR